jgi:HSP20 family protein
MPRRPVALTDLSLLQQEMRQLFHKLAELDRTSKSEGGTWEPPVDIYECKGRLVIVLEIPGLKPESLKVTMRDRQLHVTGERRGRPPSGVVAFLCMERPGGRFARSIPLDMAVDVGKAQARLSRGLLTVEMPRLKDRRGQETEIPVIRES